MDQDIIIELSKIKSVLIVIAILLFILVAGKLTETIGNILNNLGNFRIRKIRTFSAEMHEKGEYSNLIEYLGKELSNRPNCATSTYWMARGHLSMSDFENAKKLFIKLRELEPSWEKEYVSPFLKEIEEKH